MPFYVLSQSPLLLIPLDISVPLSFPQLVFERGQQPCHCTPLNRGKTLWRKRERHHRRSYFLTASNPPDFKKETRTRHLTSASFYWHSTQIVSGWSRSILIVPGQPHFNLCTHDIHLSTDRAHHLNGSINSLVVPIVLFLWHLFFLVFCTNVIQWRFRFVNVTKLLTFHWVLLTPGVRFDGQTWCFAWPLCSFSHKQVLSLHWAWVRARVAKSLMGVHVLFFLNALPHSP